MASDLTVFRNAKLSDEREVFDDAKALVEREIVKLTKVVGNDDVRRVAEVLRWMLAQIEDLKTGRKV